MRMLGAVGVVGALCAASACTTSLDEEPLFGEVTSRCEMVTPAVIETQSSPIPLAFEDGAAFLFGETWLKEVDANGSRLRDNTFARVRDVEAACDGDLDYALDDDGQPLQVIALNEEERAFNASSDDRIVLWPIGAFVFEERAVVYYDKVQLAGGDYFEGTRVGTGVCVMEPGGACIRATPNVFVDEPTLSWLWPTPSFGQGALLAEDGRAYLYSCDKRGDFDHRCRTARVDPEHATDPSAYEYLRFGDEWSDRPEDSVDDIEDQTAMSVVWNEYVGRYITFAARLLDENIELRRAPEAWGQWSAAISLFEAETPSDWFVGDVRVHPALQTNEREVVLTYHSSTEDGSGNHLATFRLSDYVRGAEP